MGSGFKNAVFKTSTTLRTSDDLLKNKMNRKQQAINAIRNARISTAITTDTTINIDSIDHNVTASTSASSSAAAAAAATILTTTTTTVDNEDHHATDTDTDTDTDADADADIATVSLAS